MPDCHLIPRVTRTYMVAANTTEFLLSFSNIAALTVTSIRVIA